MKKHLLLLAVGTLAFTACKKSNDPTGDGEGIYELPYNKEGVTANKAFLETEGREFVQKIDDLNTQPSIKALESLGNLNLPDLDFLVDAVAKIGTSKGKIAAINNVLTQMAAAASAQESENYKLSQAFGIYSYDATNDDWTKTGASNKIEFHFPAIEGGASNNAVLTIQYKASGKSFKFTETEWDQNPDGTYTERVIEKSYELPGEVTAKMTIGGAAVMNLTSTYAYHNDNLPKSANVNFNFGPYTAKVDVDNTNTQAKVNFSFAKGAETLIAAAADANFNQLSFDKITNEDDEIDFENTFLAANTSLSVGAMTMAAHVDYKSINNILKPIEAKEPNYPRWEDYFGNLEYPNRGDYNSDEEYNKAWNEYNAKQELANKKYDEDYAKYNVAYRAYEKEYTTALANALNKYGAAVVANTKTNKKIASVTFESVEITDTWGDQTHYYSELKPYLIFGDNSKVDFENFGDTGFDNLIKDIENLINKFTKN